jgi:hypothetical protein
VNDQSAYITKDLVQLMIQAGIEAYDAKTSLPRHIENQAEMRGMKEILGGVRDVLTKIEGGVTAFKWIGGIATFAWTITQIAQAALKVVETLHKGN